jgi:hypothetical protein
MSMSRLSMRSNRISTIMRVPGLDPGIVADIHVFPPPQAGEGRVGGKT